MDTGVLMRYGFEGMRQNRWKAVELEKALAQRMQVRHAQLVSSGTAALTVALASAGIGAGDEVILPTFTFVASFEAVLALGAIPVLADIDDTLGLDAKAVARKISSNTKAIMPVHMCGSMADLKPLRELCEAHGLILLEDACQAIGGTYEGQPLGSYGDLGCFSFDYVKTITCGEGGAVITNNESYARRADQYSDHGHDHTGQDRGAEGHPYLGYNYRISELNAAVGLAQIKRLDEFLAIQEHHYTILKEAIADIPGVAFRRVPEQGIQNYSFLTFFLPDEKTARSAHAALGQAGVDGCFYWYDNNWHYHKKWEHLKNALVQGPIPVPVARSLERLKNESFGQSDHWMGRSISCLVKLGWTETALANRANKLAETVQKFASGLSKEHIQ